MLNKDNLGQLLIATEWFREKYPGEPFVPVSLHHNVYASDEARTENCRVITLEAMNAFLGDVKKLFADLCGSAAAPAELQVRCDAKLKALGLTPEVIVRKYLQPFQHPIA